MSKTHRSEVRPKLEDDLNSFWKWKTTSIFQKMEDDLRFSKNGRQPKFKEMEDYFILWKMDTDLSFLNNGKQPQFFKNGKWSQFFTNWKTLLICWKWKTISIFRKLKVTSIYLQMEDNLNVLENEKWLQIFEIWNNLNMYANGRSVRKPTISIWLQLAPTGPELGTAQPQLVLFFNNF